VGAVTARSLSQLADTRVGDTWEPAADRDLAAATADDRIKSVQVQLQAYLTRCTVHITVGC